MKHSFRFKLKCEFKNCKKKMSHSVSLTLQVNFVSPNQTNGQKTLRYFEINANSNDSHSNDNYESYVILRIGICREENFNFEKFALKRKTIFMKKKVIIHQIKVV